MGLIKAAIGAAGGVLADQWKEFFYCESLDNNVLMAKGQKRTSSRSSNTHGNDNIISSGSGIAVADGQCMIIVEQGKVVEICAEPGEFTWDSSTEPSLFTGKLGDTVKNTFNLIGKRFTYGGDTGKDQRVYYFNTKEILDNKFGTANPFMFEVVNKRIGMTRTVNVRCNGIYSYKITDPILFYKQISGNVAEEYTKEEIDGQLKTEFVSALQPAFAKLSELELKPSQIPAHQNELEDAMKSALKSKWEETRGISVASIALNPITLTDEDMKKIQQLEDSATLGSNPFMMAGRMTDATANAMENAANNQSGAMNGFVGMGMAMNAGGMNAAQNMYAMGQQQISNQIQNQNQGGWTCSCGAVNMGKFCPECGAKKPDGVPTYKCDKCGWMPEDPKNPPKFCPECGDIFNDNDKN